ncbi:MAG: TPM domain-containing protein, partial [candidate division SR1 bacterium]|nr:TPM domain-containing protein [candidate division SR1 bacterium]
MKKIGLFILYILIGLFGITSANSINPMELPKFEYFVNDYSNVFTEEQRLELGMIAKNIETNSGYQIVTVLFPHREGNELFDIAIKAFNENKIGDKERNDGLLLAIATEEKKIRIVVGYGLESKIPDLLASQIIEEVIRPEVNNSNFYEAVKKFYEKLPEYLDGQAKKETLGSGISLAFTCCIFYLAISIIISIISSIVISDKSKKRNRKRYKKSWYLRNLYPLASDGMLVGIFGMLASIFLGEITSSELKETGFPLFGYIFLISTSIILNLSTFFGPEKKKRGLDSGSDRDSSSS